MTALLVVLAVLAWIPVHAYGAGRFVAVLQAERRGEAHPPHTSSCNTQLYGSRYPCDCSTGKKARVATPSRVLLWPIAWPVRAAFRAGRNAGKPTPTDMTPEVQAALETVDRFLKEGR